MNYKEEIAKVLFDSNAPKEAVLWAMSNLPDTNKKGKKKETQSKIYFKHLIYRTRHFFYYIILY